MGDSWAELGPHVVLEVVVGSTAWGLADDGSDEDVAGAFLLPFERHASLRPSPDAIAPPDRDGTFWEVGRLIRLGLAGDPSVLQALWSPRVRRATAEGRWLLEGRDAFTSRRVGAALHRFATGRIAAHERALLARRAECRLAAALARGADADEASLVRVLVEDGVVEEGEAPALLGRLAQAATDRGDTPTRALGDLAAWLGARPDPGDVRPKGLHHLPRLLRWGLGWARDGVPTAEVVDAPVRARLLAIRAGDVPLPDVLDEARALLSGLDAAFAASALPAHPDEDAADRLLVACRAAAARRSPIVARVLPGT